MAHEPKNKMDPGSPQWQDAANALAREAIKIKPCRHCGHPVICGNRCENHDCRSVNP